MPTGMQTFVQLHLPDPPPVLPARPELLRPAAPPAPEPLRPPVELRPPEPPRPAASESPSVSGPTLDMPPDIPAGCGGFIGGGSGQLKHDENEASVGDFGSGVHNFMPSLPSGHGHVVRCPRSQASPLKSGAPIATGGSPAGMPSGEVLA
jgi:hypothetical protein